MAFPCLRFHFIRKDETPRRQGSKKTNQHQGGRLPDPAMRDLCSQEGELPARKRQGRSLRGLTDAAFLGEDAQRLTATKKQAL